MNKPSRKIYFGETPVNNDEPTFKIESIMEKDLRTGFQGNSIYFYDEINTDTVCSLNRQIEDVTRQMKIIQINYNLPKAPSIDLYINSYGGEIMAAMSVVDKIRSNSVEINTICEGIAASSATLISVVGKTRSMGKHTLMLIHQLSSGMWGKYSEFEDEMKNLKLVMSIIKGVYLEKTKIGDKKLDDLLSHDLYLTSDECLKLGLVDKII